MVLVPRSYIDHGTIENDFAVVKLWRCFTGELNLFRHAGTPCGGSQRLTIVGYPTDKGRDDTKGAQMWIDTKNVVWFLDYSEHNLLEYQLSTSYGINALSLLE